MSDWLIATTLAFNLFALASGINNSKYWSTLSCNASLFFKLQATNHLELVTNLAEFLLFLHNKLFFKSDSSRSLVILSTSL